MGLNIIEHVASTLCCSVAQQVNEFALASPLGDVEDIARCRMM